MEHYYDKNNKELNRYIISVPLDGELRYFKRYAKTEKEVKEEFLSFFMSACFFRFLCPHIKYKLNLKM